MRISSAVRQVIRKLGYDIVRFTSDRPDCRRQLLLKANDIDMVLDVGANTGQYGRAIRDAGFAGRILSFEPIPEAYSQLQRAARQDSAWDCLQVALGDTDGEATLNISANSVSSSLLPASRQLTLAAPTAEYVGSITVPVRRLDTVVSEFATPDDRLWLKLDVQGYERSVLNGSRQVIQRTRVVESELSLVPLYKGQRLYRDMIDQLEMLGFDLVSIERGFSDPNTGHILQIDGIFVRSQRLHRHRGTHSSDSEVTSNDLEHYRRG